MPEVHWASAPVEWRVTAFGLAVALAAGTVAGLVPALQSLSVDLANSLKSGVGDDTRVKTRLRSVAHRGAGVRSRSFCWSAPACSSEA